MSLLARFAERMRGLALLVVALVCVLALYRATPLGALGRMAFNTVAGTHYKGPSPLAAYSGAGGRSYGFLLAVDERALAAMQATQTCIPPDQLTAIASAAEVDTASLQALLGAHATAEQEGVCRVALPAALESRAVELLGAGASRAALRADPELAARGLARALAVELRHFSGMPHAGDLAVEALVLGRSEVEAAVAAAQAAGIDQPQRLDQHQELLTGTARDRAEEAMWVLARTRLARMLWPVDARFAITSPFGKRMHPVLKTYKMHNGVDVGVPVGTQLRAILDGQVSRASYDDVSGHYVRLSHGYGVESVFCHLRSAGTPVDQEVARGDVVAASGNSGRSTGPHLHFTLRVFGRPVDPMAFVGVVAQRP